jgi:hypothetical protein
MKVGLEKLPGIPDLEMAYNEILLAQRTQGGIIDLARFVLYCQWSRFDSRLGEICVRYFSQCWRQINSVGLHEIASHGSWPNVLGVLLEFCPEKDPLFQLWKKTVTFGFGKAHWEQYYIGKRRIAGAEMLDDARFSLEEYRKWGYLSREVLLNKGSTPSAIQGGGYSHEVRAAVLKELLESHVRITTKLYRNALENRISMRQAERDLKDSKLLRAVGKTRGRFFVRR